MIARSWISTLLACALMVPSGVSAQIATKARPQEIPESSATNFDSALRCMDEMLGRTEYANGVKIGVGDLGADVATGAVTRDMVIAALSRMSEKSRVFRITANPGEKELANASTADLFIGGSVTAWEKDIGGKSPEAGISIGPLNIGMRNRRIDSTMSVTMFLQDKESVVLPLTTQSLTMALRQKSTGGDVSGSVGLLGGYVGMEFAGGDAPLQALRALIDLSLIQAVGAWAQVPYQRCLAIAQTDPKASRQAVKAFRKLTEEQRIGAISAELARLGHYAGPPTTRMTPQLRTAISDFQVQMQLPPLGLPNFETWFALTGPRFGTVPGGAAAPLGIAGNPNPLRLRVAPHGPNFEAGPHLRNFFIERGYRASFAVSAQTDAYVACFYTDAQHRMTKVFPTAQRPAERLVAGQVMIIPGPGDVFVIEPDEPGVPENITCYASSQSIQDRVPPPLRENFRPGLPSLPYTDPEQLQEVMRQVGMPELSASSFGFTAACKDAAGEWDLKCP